MLRPLILCALALPMLATAPPSSAQPEPAKEPIFQFEHTTFDVGVIEDDTQIVHPFKFTNTSNRTVNLAMGYCHLCEHPLLDKTVLKPGESANLVIVLDPAGRRGPTSASASVCDSTRISATTVRVELKADICPRVWVEPLIIGDKMPRGRPGQAEFTVTGHSRGFKIDHIEPDPAAESIDISPVEDLKDCYGKSARKQKVTVRFAKSSPVGPVKGNLRVVTTDPDARPINVNIDAEVLGTIHVRPEDAGRELRPGDPFIASFEIVAEDGPILIHSLDVAARDEATSVVVDAMPTANPSKMLVTVTGIAPYRNRQAAVLRLDVVASSLGGVAERETVTARLTLVVTTPRQTQPTPPQP